MVFRTFRNIIYKSKNVRSYTVNSLLIENYWNNLLKEIDLEKDKAFSPVENIMRRLLNDALIVKRSTGDIMPDIAATSFRNYYSSLKHSDRKQFLLILAREFGIRSNDLAEACKRYIKACETPISVSNAVIKAESALKKEIRPLYSELTSRITQQPDGMKFLIDMRADALRYTEEETQNKATMAALAEDLKQQLQSWFTIGFLELKQLTWNSPAGLLEKIVSYEKVHPIPHWDALKQRLGPGRRCYGFFHKSMPLEPLVFVQVALMPDVASSIQLILEEKNKSIESPCTGIFYSISSTQKGLSGVELGNFLIKRVVKELHLEFPGIRTFSTLSPIPNFMNWLQGRISMLEENNSFDLLKAHEAILLRHYFKTEESSWILLKKLIDIDWRSNASVQCVLKPILMRLCAHYLLHEKRRSLAFDPVANFHLRNGARILRINWMGDSSDKGYQQSACMMVNYEYNLEDIETNNKKYLMDGTISADDSVLKLLVMNDSSGNVSCQ